MKTLDILIKTIYNKTWNQYKTGTQILRNWDWFETDLRLGRKKIMKIVKKLLIMWLKCDWCVVLCEWINKSTDVKLYKFLEGDELKNVEIHS